MFNKIKIKNFQSIKNLELDLAPFTVIVGASDSGKSAFFRSLSTLISNRRGLDFITHGERLCTIEAETDNGHILLQRGKGTNDNFYEVTPKDAKTVKFSKLGGSVPEEVSAFLGIPAKDPINVASQFDKPYLLDSKEYGPSEVARILGALTNVNVIFEGARESNRQKTEANATLKIRSSDLESCETQLASYGDLEADLAIVESVADMAKTATACQEAIQQVESTVAAIKQAQLAQETAAKYANVVIPEITELERLNELIKLITDIVNKIKVNETIVQKHDSVMLNINQELADLEVKYEEALAKEGMCPLCGQKIKQ